MYEPMMTEAERDEFKPSNRKRTCDKSGELLTQEGTHKFIVVIKKHRLNVRKPLAESTISL